MINGFQFITLASALLLISCDGPREDAGEIAGAAAGIADGPLHFRPSEASGEIQDRAAQDRENAAEAQADAWSIAQMRCGPVLISARMLWRRRPTRLGDWRAAQ